MDNYRNIAKKTTIKLFIEVMTNCERERHNTFITVDKLLNM